MADGNFTYDAVRDNYRLAGGNANGLMKGSTITPEQYQRIQLDNQNNSFLGSDGLKTGLAGAHALGGLMNAYTGLKSLGLAKEQFGFQKAAANRDVANQAKLLNESRLNSGNVGLALAGGTMSGAQKTAARDKITAGNVDGSRIG